VTQAAWFSSFTFSCMKRATVQTSIPFISGSPANAYSRPMSAWKFLAAFVLMLVLTAPAPAADRPRCLSRNEQRTAIAEGRAVPLATASRSMPYGVPGELVRARLCLDSGRLVYQLTVLPWDGKVRRATVDASTGILVSER